MLRTAGRLVLSHGPLLVAIYLAGSLLQYVAIEAFGFVGAYSAVVGALLFPLVIVVRLVALVTMLLVLRSGLRNLGVIAPLPDEPAARRRAFTDALLGSILVFVAFYAAWGYLRDDANAYYSRVLEINTGLIANQSILGLESGGDGAAGSLTFSPLTVGIIVAAFVLRWAYGRYKGRLSKRVVVLAVYLEALWVVWSALLLSQAFDAVGSWVDSRQAMVWLADLRNWLAAQVAPVAWIWDAVEWLLGESGGILLLPLAWLTVAGVIFGQAVAPPPARLKGSIVDRARSGFGRLPAWTRRRSADLWGQVVERFRPVVQAIVLMWRAGPALIGGYVLLFTLVLALDALLGIALTRLVGPQSFAEFWLPYSTIVFSIPALLIEPLRLMVVAAAYDRVVGRLSAPELAGV